MNDILLTDEQVEEIVHDAHDVCSRCEGEGRLWADGQVHGYDTNRPTKACPNCDGTGRTWSGSEYEELCRAQVRKACDWIEKHNKADVFPALSGDTLLRHADVAALKAAGEGK